MTGFFFMSTNHTKEAQAVKEAFLKQLFPWMDEFYDGTQIRKTASNPKAQGITKGRALRGAQSLLLSPDSVHVDYIDGRMSKGASVKSMLGGLGGRVQKLTQGSSSPFSILESDQLHHFNPNGAYGEAAFQNPNRLLEFLQRSEDANVFYGEGEQNLKGNSLDARAHTGGRGKKTGVIFNPVSAGEGPDGNSKFSAHPRGTNDAAIKLNPKKYQSGKEMFEAAAQMRALHATDVELGRLADSSRRDFVNQAARQAAIIPEGVDIFDASADPRQMDRVRSLFSGNKSLSIGAAKSFGKASKWLVPGASLTIGFGQAGHAASQGDYAGAAAHGVGALVGEVPLIGDAVVESVAGTGLADGTLQGNLNRVAKKGPKTTAAPTGNKKFDNVFQPFHKMLYGITPTPKKPDFKQTAISAFNTP
jgi:hypothetical protein